MLRAELRHSIGALELELEFSVEPGRCLSLAGPSGSGKTTVLRLVAGTTRPDDGRISLGEEVWFDSSRGISWPPERRRCGFVFQDYALFPHLSAWRNVAYGLRATPRARRRAAAVALLERFGIAAWADASPPKLSGGQRQRLALARALAASPSVLLLDEPLSALDARTRAGAVRELTTILRELEVAVVLVTHDFTEATLLADEVGVLDGGRIVQRGTAGDLSARPATAFVADFTGAVVLTGRARRCDGELTMVELDRGGVVSTTDQGTGRVAVSVYPWEITIRQAPAIADESAQNQLRARVASLSTIANRVRVGLDAGQLLIAEVTGKAAEDLRLEVGAEVIASWKATATRLTAV